MISWNIPNSFLKKQTQQEIVQISTDQFLFQLGSNCGLCQQKIAYSSSIGICQCNHYGHQSCIKKHFSPMKFFQNQQLKCHKCKNIIKVKFEKITTIEFNFKLQYIVLIILICLLLIFLFHQLYEQSKMKIEEQNILIFVAQATGSLILILILFLIIVMIFTSHEYKVSDFQNFKSKLSVSAFENFVTPRNDDESQGTILS